MPRPVLLLYLALLSSAAHAQVLPFRHYGLAEGLADVRVNAIHQDSRGYLWFGTAEGLSRFDGERFVTYAARDGLPNPFISAIVEDGRGRIWVGTWGGGLARLLDAAPRGAPRFRSWPIAAAREANIVGAVLVEPDGTVWCGTLGGLFRAAAREDDALVFEPVLPARMEWAEAARRGADGTLWFGAGHDLVSVRGGRLVTHATPSPSLREIVSLVEQPSGRLLVVFASGIWEFTPPSAATGVGQWSRLAFDVGGPDQRLYSVVASRDGPRWIAGRRGMFHVGPFGLQPCGKAQGLGHEWVRTLFLDREGNLWIGTHLGGVYQLAAENIISYRTGTADENIVRVLQDRDGRILAATATTGVFVLEQERLRPLPGFERPPFVGVGARLRQDSRGDWWIGTDQGVYFLRGPDLRLPRARRLGPVEGISQARVWWPGLYEDRRGRVWVSSDDRSVYIQHSPAWEEPRFRRVSTTSLSTDSSVRVMSDDGRDGVWVADFEGVGRVRDMGLQRVGLYDMQVRSLLLDRRGWLWLGRRYGGLSVTREPSAERPRFETITTRDGLSSDAVWSLAEDAEGRLYLGTGKGLDRLDPTTGLMRHYAMADGLAGDMVNDCLVDRDGHVWAATSGGLSRIDPERQRPPLPPPPVYLLHVQLSGEDVALPETGTVRLGSLTLSGARNGLLVEYVAPFFGARRAMRYQHRLEGVDSDWGAPVEQRAVNYARLAPGGYRFVVRAVTPEGVAGPPAELSFRVLHPLWRQPWFLTLLAGTLALAAYTVHRRRVARLLELERIRTRIATDLHDDIGSNLTRISMLSEVARRELDGTERALGERLDRIAGISRELVDSMSDIVWAVDPSRDTLGDLSHRMRRFADDLLGAADIALEFQAQADEALPVGAEVRREVFLVFKEAIHNLARHSGAHRAEVNLAADAQWLSLLVRDDGRGFDPEGGYEGHGLDSMARRARRLGGSLRIECSSGGGARLQLTVPLARKPAVGTAAG